MPTGTPPPSHSRRTPARHLGFTSVLYDHLHDAEVDEREPPFFRDLNLDQLVDSIARERKGYELKPFFYSPLTTPAAVHYRHEVFRDLEKEEVSAPIDTFSRRIREVGARLTGAEKRYRHEREGWILQAADVYCTAVRSLREYLVTADLRSRGLVAFRRYLTGYTQSDDFASLVRDTQVVREALASVAYCIHINGKYVRVRRYEGEADYTPEIEETFARFKQDATTGYLAKLSDSGGMNHIEARILGLVAKLYPAVFSALDEYCARHRAFLDATLSRFAQEVQFYLAYLEFMDRRKAAGTHFCYPSVSSQSKSVYAKEAVDLALANTLGSGGVVANNFHLEGRERVLVVTGANQGGKTTFARMFAQLHYLASLGLPVPGREARLFLPDQIFTHFERQEHIETLQGKLESDLLRVRDILENATPNSVVILNESFASTTPHDALVLTREVMKRIRGLDLLCVAVTFLDEIASLDDGTVSMVAMVDDRDPSIRTYRVVRRPADGKAYAVALATKYGLTSSQIKQRVGERGDS